MLSFLYHNTGGETENEINSYIAVLIITVFGAFMALIIIHIINLDTVVVIKAHDAVIYTYLQ